MNWDVFISHATEDKALVAEPLARALKNAGLSVWYDQFEIRLGDRLGRAINNGLSKSRFGIVILSPAFFKKHWTKLELDGLAQREEGGRKVILPVWYNVTKDEVRAESLLLADRVAVKWSDGLHAVVEAILAVVNPQYESFDENKLVGSLLRIKKYTYFLWKDLVTHASDEACFSTKIKDSTLRKIMPDLELLTVGTGLKHETKISPFDDRSEELVHEISITETTPVFWRIVNKAIQIAQN